MKKLYLLLALSLIVALVAGCSANKFAAPHAGLPYQLSVDTLNRTQYEVLEQATATGTTRMVALWPLPIWWTSSDDGTYALWGFRIKNKSREIAKGRAVRQIPTADDLLNPIIRDEIVNVFWYKRVTSTVTGKAIAIKTDKQCLDTDSNCWESIKWQDNDKD
jgi:hypothetical protein